MTPTLLAAHQRSKRFHAEIARKAAELARSKIVAPAPQPCEIVALPMRREYATAKRLQTQPFLGGKILLAVADEFELTVEQLISPSRSPMLCSARYIATGLFLDMTRMSFGWIGKQLGGRDHSTIFQSQPKVRELLDQESIRNRVDQIKADILRAA